MSANTNLEPGRFPLAGHFSTPAQQIDAGKMGMWGFLVTEVLLFGGLFVAYGIYRYLHPQAFIDAHGHLNVTMGTLNTVVLLVSSLTVALAIRAAQTDNPGQVTIHLVITLVCAATFMVVKYLSTLTKSTRVCCRGLTSPTQRCPTQTKLTFSLAFTS